MQSPITIKELINLGVNVQVGPEHTPVSMKEFVRLAVSNDIHLTIDGKEATPITLKELARIGGKHLTIIC